MVLSADLPEIILSMKVALKTLPWKDLDDWEQVRKIPQLSAYPLDEFVNRELVLEEITEYLKHPKNNKNNTSLFTIQSAPGLGKTRLLQVVGDRDPGRIPQEMQTLLGNCLPLAITFNCFSIGRGENPFYETAIRLLFS